MKAALCTTLEGPEAIVLGDIPDAVPGSGDAVVEVRCAGLNHADVLRSRGKYQERPPLPFSPAGELAGVIIRAPAGCLLTPGQRVMGYIGHGAARQRVVVPAGRLVAVPDGVSDALASALPVTYGTALHALRARTGLQAGGTVVVLGAGGGAGLAAIEIAKLLGASVIAVASADKLPACMQLGADVAINRETSDLKQAIRSACTRPEGPDVIYDCVGGALAEPAFRSLRPGGQFLVVGFASRQVPALPLDIALVKELSIVGINWPASVTRDAESYRTDMALALDAVAAGRLAPRIHATVPLDQIAAALSVLDRGEAIGKIVINID